MRGFYGAHATAQNKFVLLTNLQTPGGGAATDLSRTINLIKDFISELIERLPSIPGKAAGVAVIRSEYAIINPRGDKV